MLVSKLLGEKYKEKPNDAQITSHIFLLRGGYIRQVGTGIYSLLTPAKRICDKISNIIREEMDIADGQEVLMPVAIPAELWKESGRFDSVGGELVRFKDRTDKDMVLGMTHEEPAVQLARSEAKSYQNYPFMIYQIQTKFRDELRARGGLIRVREFTMKDAYSFHTSNECLEDYYEVMHDSYVKIYKRSGLKNFISVKSDTGMMGGKKAHEFMYLTDIGEDSLIVCEHCDYRSNSEVAISNIDKYVGIDGEIKEVHTPNLTDIESLSKYLNLDQKSMIKTTIFFTETDKKPVIVFIRGDLKVSENKLIKVVKDNVIPMDSDYNLYNIVPGFVGPYNNEFTKNCIVVYDNSLKDCISMTCGANKIDYHYTNINVVRDLKIEEFHDCAEVNVGDKCISCGNPLTLKRGVEIGNIFQLGTKYTSSMNMTYTDKAGSTQTPTMGCYGIGVGRLLSCIIEDSHDEYGPIWPISVAPWHIQICVLNANDEEVLEKGHEIYNMLNTKYQTILDDRKVSAGIMFAEADLLGVPIRIVVNKRLLENNFVEISTRNKKIKIEVPFSELEEQLNLIYNKLWINLKEETDDCKKYQGLSK